MFYKIMLLIFFFLRSSYLKEICLIELNCTFHGTSDTEVRCQETNLSMATFPCQNERSHSNILRLLINNKNFTVLPSKILRKFKKLRTLDLSHNQIEFIQDDAFIRLIKIEYIFLSNNRIKNISSFHFAENTWLRGLYFDNNILTSIAVNAFENLRLKYLTVAQNVLNSLEFLSSITSIQFLMIENNNFDFSVENKFNEF